MHTFAAPVLSDPTIPAGYMRHYVPLPDDVVAALSADAVKRVEGTLEGHPFERALHQGSDGQTCLRFGATWLRRAGLDVGSVALVELRAKADPNHVPIPEELALALGESPEMEHKWHCLTPGKRRTLAYDVDRAKRPETRRRRAAKVLEQLGDMPG